jgi:TetR/AcrR family transcriptional regulator, regulator of autoinduction and epiphytic fitness
LVSIASQSVAFWGEPASKSAPNIRGARTRRRIAEAALALLEERDSPPTSRDIAERAGVSLRLIFHHFEDLDALHDAVGALIADRFEELALHGTCELPLSQRIESTVRLRAKLFESFGNLPRNVTVLAPSNPGMTARLAETRAMTLGFLETTFDPELRLTGLGRTNLLAVLDVATSWTTWDRLRTVNRLSVSSSRRVMSQMLGAALSPRMSRAED